MVDVKNDGVTKLAWPQSDNLHKFQRPEFICGWGAAFVNICVTYPINKVMFRQMLHGSKTQVVIQELRREGFSHIYRGLAAPLLQKTTSVSIMFGLYYEFYRQLRQYFPTLWIPGQKIIAAMLAGTVESVLTPFERVQALMQDKKYHKNFNNTYHAFRELQKYGIAEFYRGQSAILCRNGPSSALFFLGRDYVHYAYPHIEKRSEKLFLDFVTGALLGAAISTVFYPLNVIKVRMQTTLGGDFCHLRSTLAIILQERNNRVTNLFRGAHLNFTRSFISWGIVNASFEYFIHFFRDEVD